MKHTLPILLAAVLFLGTTACDRPSAPEGTETVAQSDTSLSEEEIIATADRLVAEGAKVFFWYYSDFSEDLGIALDDEIVDPEGDGGYWQAVGIFDTMEALRNATEAVFTTRFCERELYDLIELGKFREFDGVLYHNQNVGGMGWIYGLPKQWRIDYIQPTQIELTATCDGVDYESGAGDTREYEFAFTLIYENNGWKLDNFYQIGKLNTAQIQKTVTALLAAGLLGESWQDVRQVVQPDDLSLSTFYCSLKSDYSAIDTEAFEARMNIDFGLETDFLHGLEEYDAATDTYRVSGDILVTVHAPYDDFLRIDSIEELDNDGAVRVRYRVLWGPMAAEGDGSDTAYAGEIALQQLGDYFTVESVTVTEDHSDKYG